MILTPAPRRVLQPQLIASQIIHGDHLTSYICMYTCVYIYIYIHGDARLYMQYVRKQVTILPSANASDTSTRLWHHVGPPSSWHSQWCRCTLGCSSWGQVVHLTAFGLSREPPNSLGKLHQFRRLQYHNIYWCKQKLPYEGCNTAYTQFLVVSCKGQKPSWLCSGKPITFSLGLQLIGLYTHIYIYAYI